MSEVCDCQDPAAGEPAPRPVLELAQHFADLARQISAAPRDPYNPVAEMHAGSVQHQYAEMAAQLALVSIAESLDGIKRVLSAEPERPRP